jgi:DNA-binding IclR family transcriptional regulator
MLRDPEVPMPRYPTRAPAQSSSKAGGVAAVDRALMLLTAFRSGDRSLTLGELAQRTGLVKSTTLRLLASLLHFGIVQKLEDGRYSLGPEVARLHSVYTSSFSLETVVMPVLQGLVKKTKESAAFHVRQGDHRLCLYRVDSPQAIRDHAKAGDILPLDRGAGGRLLMAFTGAKGANYEQIRKDGVVATLGDRSPELAGISAPVFQSGGVLAGAVTLTMPAARFKKSLVAPVKEAAAAISARLGAAG